MDKKSKLLAFLFVTFLLTYEFSVYIANDMIMPGMIQIVKEFGVSDSYIASSLTLFVLGGATLQIFLGPLSDRYGSRKIMLSGVFLFLLATVLNGLSRSIEEFMLFRFLQGMGICFIGVIGYAKVQQMFEEKQAVKIISAMTTISIIAPLIGPLAGSLFLKHFSNWRGINLIIATFAFISLLGLYFYFPKDKLTNQKIALSKENIISEALGNYTKILKNRKFLFGVLSFAFVETPIIIWIALSPSILIRKAGLSTLEYGFLQFPVFGSFILGVVLLQLLIKNHDLQFLIKLGTLFIGIALLFGFMFSILLDQHYLVLVIAFSLYSLGLGLVSSSINRLTLFSSNVAKGSVTAALSIILVILLAVGTELANYLYLELNNVKLAGYLSVLFALYLISLYFFMNLKQIDEDHENTFVAKQSVGN